MFWKYLNHVRKDDKPEGDGNEDIGWILVNTTISSWFQCQQILQILFNHFPAYQDATA